MCIGKPTSVHMCVPTWGETICDKAIFDKPPIQVEQQLIADSLGVFTPRLISV